MKNSKYGFCLSQAHYVEKILNHFDVDPLKTPYDSSIYLKKE